MNRVIFTLSCAGGSARSFVPWKRRLDFRVINLEYPGHWDRWEESLCDDVACIVEDIESQILDYIMEYGENEVFIVGHSMGALLAWLVADKLNSVIEVKGVVIIAMVAPSKIDKLEFKNLNDECNIKEFLKKIRQIPEKTLSSNSFMNFFLPIIENDFRLFNNMTRNKNAFRRLQIPCLVMFSGEDSLVDIEDIRKWSEYTEDAEYIELSGNHFFPYCSTQVPAVCRAITKFVCGL